LTAYNAKGTAVEAQSTRYLYGSTVNAAWQTGVVAPDSTDTLSQNATTKIWSFNSGTDHTATAYDRLGRTTNTTDPRGVVHAYTYDSAGRLSADIVTSLGDAGQNVDGTVRRLGTTYDDLGRVHLVTSYGDTAGTNVLNEVKSEYNGWGQV
jgi:YD repeat-containing protein